MKNATQETKTLHILYGIFGVALVSSVLPFVSAAIISLIFFIWILVAAYIARSRAQKHDLVHNHASYIIRTLWISALFSMICMITAVLYMLGTIDYTPFESCAYTLAQQGIDAVQAMGTAEIYALIEPCVKPFLDGNMVALIIAGIIGLVPLMLYIFYRFFKGATRAVKGYRIVDPKSWF